MALLRTCLHMQRQIQANKSKNIAAELVDMADVTESITPFRYFNYISDYSLFSEKNFPLEKIFENINK